MVTHTTKRAVFNLVDSKKFEFKEHLFKKPKKYFKGTSIKSSLIMIVVL